jgi:predicted amidohydrolase YtcJ
MSDLLLIADSITGCADADAVLIRNGRISAIGWSKDLGDRSLPAQRFDGVITPGFCDAHLHPIGYTAALHRPSLKDATDFEAVADAMAAAAAARPDGTAVTGLRLDDESLDEGRLPDRHLLDRAVPDRPALMIRYCGHVSVANTRALELAGIGPDTSDPEGGSIDRDDLGLPTGVLRETAGDLVSTAIRSLAPPVTRHDVLGGMTALASLGLTSVGGIVDISAGCWAGGGSELDALIGAAPDLPIRVAALVIAHTPEDLELAAERMADAGPRLSFLGLKAFADGSLGGRTAAMYEPYHDLPGQRGTHRLDPDWAHRMSTATLRLGGRVAIHAIGDAANGRVLDVMEHLLEEGADPTMLRIEHASVLTPEDITRLALLGVTAVVQPAFLASETSWLENRLGPDRLTRTYAFRSLADAGVPLAGSSDSPVEPPHPLWGMAAARDRCGLTPAERLTAGEAYDLFTIDSATAIGETRLLQPGERADLVVLDRDPIETGADGLRAARVLATFVEGSPVEVPDGMTAWQS